MSDIRDICDYCLDEERDCKMCPLGNPCLNCEDYDNNDGYIIVEQEGKIYTIRERDEE